MALRVHSIPDWHPRDEEFYASTARPHADCGGQWVVVATDVEPSLANIMSVSEEQPKVRRLECRSCGAISEQWNMPEREEKADATP